MIKNPGVHQTHCCLKHGCKYGDPKCPIVTRELVQVFPCEDCYQASRVSRGFPFEESEDTFHKVSSKDHAATITFFLDFLHENRVVLSDHRIGEHNRTLSSEDVLTLKNDFIKKCSVKV